MGSKGSQTTQTNQSQNSTYVPTGGGYIAGALNNATGLANQGVPTIPTAPVAGFSQDQLNAFQNVNNAQGMAQPYINQARNYFQQSADPNTAASYYNPMAANVTSQLQNIFGQQQQQNNSNLVQSAGGVGADRIAVGQGNLANQQGLAAGQTYANLWQQAQQNAQSALQGAGYGTAALGSQAQNSALQGAQAQLGTGGLQQQLSQAQLNAPYQQQLAQQALPYQLGQWYSGQVGALAPSLGGSTFGTGTGTTTSQYNPSIFSQIASLAGIGGGLLGKGSGGAVPYARGGGVNPYAFDEGGSAPIDVSGGLFSGKKLFRLPDQSLPPAQTHVPNLIGMNQQQQPNMQPQGMQGMQGMQALGRSLNKTGLGDAAQDWMQDTGLLARGGTANPYGLPHFDDGGGAGDGGDSGGEGPGSGDAGGGGGGNGDGGGDGGGGGNGDGGEGGSVGAGDTGGFGSDAAAAGLAGAQAGIASGLGNLGEDNATSDAGFGFGTASLGPSQGFGTDADAAAAQAATSGLATGVGNLGDTSSMTGGINAGNVNGAGINAGFGFGFGTEGLGFGNMTGPNDTEATEANTAPPSVPGIQGYGPPASPSLAATLGFSQPSLSPMAQNAQEAAVAQAMMDASPTGLPGQTSSVAESMPAAPVAAPSLGNFAASLAALGPSQGFSNPAAPASPATAPGVSEPSPALSFGPTSGPTSGFGMASPGMGSPAAAGMGSPGGGDVALLRALGQLAGQPYGYGAMPMGYPQPVNVKTYDAGGSVNPYSLPRYDDGGDVDFGDAGADDSQLGGVGLAYQRLANMGLQRGQIDAAVQRAGPAAAAVIPRAIAGLESSGRGVNGPSGRYANDLYQQFPAFAKQYGAGESGVMNYAQQVLKANPKATFGDFYGGYVTGTGDPATARMQNLLTTQQPGAQGAYANMMNKARRGEIPDPSTPLASLVGGGAQGNTALGYDTTNATSPAVSAINTALAGSSAQNANPYAAPPPDAAAGLNKPALGYAAAAMQPPQGGQQGYFSKLFHDPARMALIMGGLSAVTPAGFAGGFSQGMQLVQHQQSADLQAKKLEQEANFHSDTMKHQGTQEQETARYHSWEMGKPVPFNAGYDQYGQPLHGLMVPEKQPDGTIKWTPQTPGQPQTQAAPGNYQPPGQQSATQAQAEPAEGEGVIPANARLISGGAFDFSHGAPTIEKGMEVPEPQGVAGASSSALKRDAETYVQTGKLPPTRGIKGKFASDANDYRRAVQNYGDALLSSRGISPQQSADMWREAPGMLRFVLGPDGRSTIALGTAVRHLDTLQQLSKAWQAGDIQTVNRLRAIVSREFGADAATNLQAAGRIIGPEIIKALGVAGAGTAEERGSAAQGFSTSASPEQMAGAIRTTQSLLGGQLEGRQRQAASAGVSAERFKNLIGERPYELLSHAGGGGGEGGARPAPTQKDLDYVKAHPEMRDRFMKQFGVAP